MNNKQLLEVTNPSTGLLLTQLEMDSLEGAMGKLTAARALFDDKPRHLSLHERVPMLEKLAASIERDHENFTLTIAEEGGKPLRDASVEVTRAIAGIRNAIATVSEHRGSVIPMEHRASSAGRIALTQRFPRGVVLAFSAFNHPLNLIVHQIIPAFATACPCVVKPAPDPPLSCLKLIAAMHEAGVPKDYISCVVTNDLEIANALEHGGIAPSIVTASADMAKAIPAITKGGFYHAGQVCVSTQRVYVDSSIYTDFVDRLKKAVNDLIVGDASDASTDVGPLIREAEATRVHTWVKEAIAGGATLAAGGSAPEGNFLAPTLLLSPSPEAKVSAQEIFGPVVCVYPVENFEQALSLVNTDAFAGLNESGLGVGGIPYTIEDIQFEKMLVLNKN